MLKQAVKVLFSLLFLRLKPKKKKEILLVAEYDKSGGTRTYFIYLLHFLYNQGYNVSVLSVKKKIEDEEVALLLKKYGFQLLPHHFDFWCISLDEIPNGLSKKQLIQYQFSELRFWCNLQNYYRFSSIILSVGYPENFLYIFLLPLRITYILHSAVLKKTDKYKRSMLRLCLGSKKRILTVSLFAKQSIEKYWLNKKPSDAVQFVHNYYYPTIAATKNRVVKTVKKILTIGSVESYKNPLLFIEVAKAVISGNKNESIEFVWAGDGSMIDTCRKASANYSQIQFIGDVNNVDELYTEASIYYQPSLLESHGIATLGAMCQRLPCIVSEHGGLKESVVNGESGYVIAVDNIEESVEKINVLSQNKTLRDEMGERGYHLFSERFSKDIWYKKMKILFN